MIEFQVTFADVEAARRLARAALEARLAACVNIGSTVHSLFWWQGEIAEEAEVVALFKTSEARADELAAFIADEHDYDTPAIIRQEGLTANADFARWVEEETRAE